MGKHNVPLAIILVIALLLLCGTTLHLDDSARLPGQASAPLSDIIISEICAKNDTIIEDSDDKHRDYIELYNPGEALNLAGYTLTDGTRHSAPLGDFYLPAGGYRIIFLDNDTTGFALSSTGGDCIQLLDPYGRIVVQTSTSAMSADQVMLYDSDGTYLLSSMASPDFPNDAAGVAAFREGSEAVDPLLVISEMLTRNQSAVPDENGVYADAIELFNDSSEDIHLGLYCITDNPASRFRYRLPDRTLSPGEFVVIFCDSLNYIADNGHIHANFSLSVGETLMLTGPDGSYSALDVGLISDNTSLALAENGSYIPMGVSLGYPNTAEGILLCAEAILDRNLPLVINELLLSASGVPYQGKFCDVVELRNISDQSVSTEGWYLSDGGDPYAYPLPAEKLSPGEMLVIVCSQETTGFGLSEGEVLRLTAPSLRHSPTVNCVIPESGMSIVRLSEGYSTDLPSLGYDNTEQGQLSWQVERIPSGLMINEVMTSNESYLRGPYATTCDWVELYNASEETIDLSTYSLSDDPDTGFMMPEILLEPGQYQIILLSEDTRNLISGYPVLPFSLSAAGEALYLQGDNAVYDYMLIPALTQNSSYGRTESVVDVLKKPTPGAANSAASRISNMPETMTAQGIYNDITALDVVLCGNGPIYYTTDCSQPTRRSRRYTDSITLDQTTVIRAICVEDGKVASDTLNLVYIINENDTLPVISLVTEPSNLWSSESGIYVSGDSVPEGANDPNANYFQDWEREAYVSFFDTDGTGFAAPCGIKIYGAFSRAQPKKSLSVLFRGSYGLSQLNYPLFGDSGVDSYESFILRAGGQDSFRARVRDELITSMAAEYTDIAVQKYRPAVLYLNGEYWGLHYIREKISEHYVAANYNVPADTVTLTERNGSSCRPYQKLVDYAATHDLSDPACYAHIGTMMDIPQYTDYIISQICIGNYDNSNVRFFTYEGGKWTWILYDTDLGLLHTDYNSVEEHLNPNGTAGYDYIHTTLITALLKNRDYRAMFLRRLAWQINTIWTEENILSHAQAMIDQIAPDMEKDFSRWSSSTKSWNKHLNKLYSFAKERNDYLLPYIQDYFDLSKQEMRQYGFPV